MALHEHRGDVGIEADGEQDRRHLDRPLTDDARLVGDRQGMKVDDPVEHVLVVLARHPLTQRPEVDTEVDITGGLQAGEDSGHDPNATESPLRRPCRVVQASRSRSANRRWAHSSSRIT